MKAAMDLVRYDELLIRDSLLNKNIANLEAIIKKKDEEIESHKGQIDRLNLMYNTQAGIMREVDVRYKELERKYKKEVRAGRFKLVCLGGAVVTGLYLWLK